MKYYLVTIKTVSRRTDANTTERMVYKLSDEKDIKEKLLDLFKVRGYQIVREEVNNETINEYVGFDRKIYADSYTPYKTECLNAVYIQMYELEEDVFKIMERRDKYLQIKY